jgi:hypothetical protein
VFASLKVSRKGAKRRKEKEATGHERKEKVRHSLHSNLLSFNQGR